ncbi:ThuA domain-containing protein [Aliifodinibius sp. S!AR15-10]|uniref:ThuA domain-containing protein n=1 Tax=Aliifodinibius sp. S!AR15-10 TaxID=2950437 RepID=UPI0028641831|nr:ThuA domain-containing protein [Aliifodinibius sp. S!AR15-10]MDR8394084.1 ThuA domain-containing protein [Aliifodinibius sp. S!AR15-10]
MVRSTQLIQEFLFKKEPLVWLTAFFSFCLLVTGWPFGNTASAQPNEVIFLAGPKDHGMAGRHDYPADLKVLAESLRKSNNIGDVTTKVLVGKAPRDLNVYKNAAAIVINSSSDRSGREVHPLFPPNPNTSGTGYDEETEAFLEGLNEILKNNKAGVVVIHYALWIENWAARGYYMDWLGGFWVQMGSRNPVDIWEMEPQNVEHPILNGVSPWKYRDEIFSRFFLPDQISGRTELLTAMPTYSDEQSRLPENYGTQVAAWSYTREDGGRGFAFGGMDFHDNMEIDDYRKFVLNGIVWSAGMKVPPEGVHSPTPEIEIGR